MSKIIKTKRLIIRPLELADTLFMLALANSEGWLRFIGDRNINSEKEAKAYIATILNTPKFYYNVILIQGSHEPIGVLSFIHRQNYSYPDFGFALLPKFQKKGYAEEAAKEYLNELLIEKASENIIAITKTQNSSSIDLLKKLGFAFVSKDENSIEDLDVYSIKS